VVLDATSAAGALLGYDARRHHVGGRAGPRRLPATARSRRSDRPSHVLLHRPWIRRRRRARARSRHGDRRPPIVNVPVQGIVAEADSALGALVSFDATATDASDVRCRSTAHPRRRRARRCCSR